MLWGCGDRGKSAVPSAMDAERWAVAWLGVLNSRSLEQVDGLFPQATRYWSSALSAPIPSARVARHIQGFWRLFPEGRVERRAVHRGPGRVVIEWYAWPDPRDEEKVWSGATVFSFGDSGMSEVRSFFDPIVLLPYLFRKQL